MGRKQRVSMIPTLVPVPVPVPLSMPMAMLVPMLVAARIPMPIPCTPAFARRPRQLAVDLGRLVQLLAWSASASASTSTAELARCRHSEGPDHCPDGHGGGQQSSSSIWVICHVRIWDEPRPIRYQWGERFRRSAQKGGFMFWLKDGCSSNPGRSELNYLTNYGAWFKFR
ncbi:hypothetical protein F4777DRAFT_390706 [Nemania sp. FL0916]|nr:hypothetical protein F4777DRAFT_390706 [Nemania sp. FL0916]